ncbi:MAG: hypothetical protein J0I21_08170 [Alphaproteobacteria bacterium]|nr:hypothetical protein [Alphaproteobacteria bacterium]
MARKPTAIAALDIVAEGLAQPDGLAERLARSRAARPAATPAPVAPVERNAWRRGKTLLQVALPEQVHLELAILAKRRRLTLSRLVKDALNEWLERHGHALRVPE